MSLVTAAQELKRKVKSTEEIRLRYLGNKFPLLPGFNRTALADWVHVNISSGELVLHVELQLDINGQWENYRFPPPDPPG